MGLRGGVAAAGAAAQVIVLVSRLELLASWLGLAALVVLAALTVALVRRRKT